MTRAPSCLLSLGRIRGSCHQFLLEVTVEVVLEAHEPGLLVGRGEFELLIPAHVELALAVDHHYAFPRVLDGDRYLAPRGNDERPCRESERRDGCNDERVNSWINYCGSDAHRVASGARGRGDDQSISAHLSRRLSVDLDGEVSHLRDVSSMDNGFVRCVLQPSAVHDGL